MVKVNKTNLTLGYNLRKYRKLRRLTQKELSDIVKISPKHLCKIENGNSFISSKLLVKISHALNVPEYILFDKGNSILVKQVIVCESNISYENSELLKVSGETAFNKK